MINFRALPVIVMALSCRPSSAAYNGAITAATAGSGRASVEATDSPYLNPATIPFVRGYNFTTSYSSATASTVGSGGSSDLSLTLTDNMKDTVVPTSLGYTQGTVFRADQSKVTSKDVRLAFGERFSKNFSFGLAGHYKNDRTEMDSYGQTNLTLAGAMALTENISLGLVMDDILGASPSIPEDLKVRPNTGLGFSYNYKRVIRTKVDLVSGSNNNFGKPTLSGGVETFMNKWLILRIGMGRNQERSSNIFAGGLGFQGPKFGIHYAYQSTQEEQNLNRHSVDLAIPIW